MIPSVLEFLFLQKNSFLPLQNRPKSSLLKHPLHDLKPNSNFHSRNNPSLIIFLTQKSIMGVSFHLTNLRYVVFYVVFCVFWYFLKFLIKSLLFKNSKTINR